MKKWNLLFAGLISTALLPACGARDISFDLLSETANFSQSAAEVNGKIDILWVTDNSGSMATSQQAIADNFERFIEKFQEKGFDFQIAITTTDAYRDLFTVNGVKSVYINGNYNLNGVTYTSPKVLRPDTPHLREAFITNIIRGIDGSGDERAFQSMKTALSNPYNTNDLGFPRRDAFLSVIIVSDEDDMSWDNVDMIDNQSDTRLHTPGSYDDFLMSFTNSTETNRHYNVNTVAVYGTDTMTDMQCKTLLNTDGFDRKIGIRYKALSDFSGGILGSLCGDFGTTLASISNKIIELSTQFYLDRLPGVNSLRVFVNNIEVPENSVNGFVYNEINNSISFFGTAVPEAGASIRVSYDPIELR